MGKAEDNFFKLSEHVSYIALPTNIGLISVPSKDGSTKIYLIDSGNDSEIGRILLEFIESKFNKARLVAIINTHSHADHCGANEYLKEKTGCQIWASRGEAALMEFPELETSLIWGGAAIKDLRTKYFLADSCHTDKKFLNNDTLTIEGIQIKVFSLPGHYLDQTGFLISDTDGKKSCFLGDAISGRNVIKKYWIQYLLNERKTKESLQKISKIKADFYIPGHGNMVKEIEGLAELNILALLETENLILEELNSPRTTEEILKSVADRNDIQLKLSQYVLIKSTLRAYLSSLFDEGKISYTIENNILHWVKL